MKYDLDGWFSFKANNLLSGRNNPLPNPELPVVVLYRRGAALPNLCSAVVGMLGEARAVKDR